MNHVIDQLNLMNAFALAAAIMRRNAEGVRKREQLAAGDWWQP